MTAERQDREPCPTTPLGAVIAGCVALRRDGMLAMTNRSMIQQETQRENGMRVQVCFWFDVEDYVTPESDVALGRLIDILDRHGVKATFKMVAEKVRGLQRRGHYDIVQKLRAHDVGYHTEYHSRPPSIAEYMLGLGWEEGRDEFIRREQSGLDTLRSAFQRTPSCYGQPGGAWAPQVYPALRQWGNPSLPGRGAVDQPPGASSLVLWHPELDGAGRLDAHWDIQRTRCRSRASEESGEMVEQVSHTGGENQSLCTRV